jgi:hypothetical protein
MTSKDCKGFLDMAWLAGLRELDNKYPSAGFGEVAKEHERLFRQKAERNKAEVTPE